MQIQHIATVHQFTFELFNNNVRRSVYKT